jgi:4-amino-4-deoxy-L-arabinose transferase-like glycosyltransferase
LRFDDRHAPLLLAAAYFVLALHGAGASDITGDDEAREAGIVQDVVAGHWLWPRFNADLIPDKPTGYHWLAALPCGALGFSETAVRLPSALAAAALVGWTTRFGMQTLGGAAGIAAGGLLATFPALFDRATVARPDALMLLLLSAALGLAFRAHRERRPRDATRALVLLGCATIVKGPVAPALFAVTVGTFLAWERDPKGVRALVNLPGLAALAVLGGGWYALALAGWGDDFVHQHLVGRYLRNLAGGLVRGEAYSPKPFLYHATFYPLHLLAIAVPWTPLVVAALVRLWRRRAFGSPLVRFLVCWAVAPVLVFTPAEYKLRYYLLPSLPALALLAAPLAAELVARPVGTPRASRASLAAAALLLVAGGVAAWIALARPEWLSRSDRDTMDAVLDAMPGGRGALAVVTGALVGIATTVVALRLWGPLLTATGALAVGWLAVAAPRIAAATTDATSFRELARVARERFPPASALAFYGPVVRTVVVYVGRPIPSLGRQASRIAAGMGVIATLPAYQALAQGGYVGDSLAVVEGRTGNLERGTLVLAEGREKSR